jgi:nucleoside-diphosphate-sugar epimerase
VAEALSGKTVLVTGATGFLGGALSLRLASEGAWVRALARHPEKGAFLREAEGVEIVKGNITQADQINDLFKECDLVFHTAASTSGTIEKQRNNTVIGAQNVTRAAVNAGVERLIHVSTIAVYGYRLSGDITEDTPQRPGHDPYNIAKAEAEKALREIAGEHGLPYSIIRPGMIYGPRSNMWTGELFKLAKRRPTPFIGRGQGSTFPIYVDDVLDMMLILATHPAAVGEAFHCTPDPSPTWREFLSGYSKLAGHQSWLPIPPILFKAFAAIVGVVARPQTQAKALPDLVYLAQQRVTFKMSKARDLLGWQPKVDLQHGIQQCAPWLREQGLLD